MELKTIPDEAFVYPFHAIPAADENEAADILVQQEGYPHAADTPAEGKAEAADDEGVVADDIEDIDYDGDHHRVDGLVGTAQGGGEGEG